MRRAPQCLELTSCFSGRTAASAERRQQRTQGSQTMCSQSIHNFLTCLFFGLSWQTALELSVSSLCCFVGLLWLTTSLVGFVLCRCSGHWGSLQISVSGRVWASIFYAAKHGAPTSFLHTEDNPLRWKSSILLPSNLGGYCGNKGAMVTVTGGGGYRGNDRRHGDCITVGYIRGIRKETRSIFDHCLCAQKKSSVFLRCTCVLHR